MFSGATHAVRRFSLLLLEEGELYVEDFVATARWPHSVAGNWQRLPRLPGTLRLCTKSVFFEPDDTRVPIVRLPFQYVEGLEGMGDRRLVLTASRLVKMRANAADAPYVVERAGQHAQQQQQQQQGQHPHSPHSRSQPHNHQPQQQQHPHPHLFHWEFELAYATLEGVMPLAQQMMVASRLPPAEQEEFLQAAMQAAEAGQRFDIGLLRNPGERIVAELACTLLSQGALVREPGRLFVTDSRLYFQPLHNISGDAPVSCHPLAAVAAAARRRSSLRDVALEVFFSEPPEQQQHLAPPPAWGGASALFAFGSREERERAVEALTSQPALGTALPGGREAAAACSAILEADPSWLSRVTAAWQRGRMCNLDYLLFLNLASGRSFSDLSQYPVFPWVLADYSSPQLDLDDPSSFRDLSRPVGALNPRRLEMLRQRCTDMASFSPEPPFLYGSHYSTPGFTMFWLVRAAPAHMLRLQNGRFDAPDRLFCSVKDAWEGVTSANPADVKELIPEFFLRHDFLLNSRSLALGTRQNGRPVGDVELPAWAAVGGAVHFQAMLRAALEAPYVSANLHHWIDLIFGIKQRGEAAMEADNVFRHTCYEGAVDIESVADRTERIALETQINEFGQCPRQLFPSKHPQRLVCPPAELPSTAEAAAAAAAAAGASGGGSSHALPLALVSTILAAAAEGHGHSPRVEVPPLLAELDALAARRKLEREQAAAAAMAAAEAADAAAAGQPALPGRASEDAPAAAGSPTKQQQLAGSSSSGRLRSLGAWAAERRQAVGERLVGSVGAVRDAWAGPQASGGSSSRLQSLFSRRDSASGSSADITAAAATAEAAGGSAAGGTTAPAAPAVAASPEGAAAAEVAAAGSQPQPGRSPSQSPAARVAAGLVGSIGGKLSSLGPRGSQQPDAASSTPPADSSVLPSAASPRQQRQQQQQQQRQPQLAGAEAAAVASSAAPPGALWKFSRRGAQPVDASRAAAAAVVGDSSDDEAAGAEQEEREQQHGSPPGSLLSGRGQPGSAASQLLEAQRQRMLARGGSPGSAAAAAGAATTPLAATAAAQARPGSGSARRPAGRGWYGPGLRDRLRPTRVLAAGGESVNGCALAEAAGGGGLHVYSASHSGAVRVHSVRSGEQVRAASLSEQPLTCVALLPSPEGDASGRQHPLVVCGSFDASVIAYSPDYGSQQGSFQAAGDAVASLQVLGNTSSGTGGSSTSAKLVVGSWDGSIKVWELAEGRHPWAPGRLAQPTAEAVAPSSVWAVAASEEGHLVLAGTEDGLVAAWDLRQPRPQPLWQHQLVADNYVGGLEFCPGGSSQAGTSSAVVVAAADGSLTLLDLRRGGSAVAVAAAVSPSGMPLRCCATDGRVVLAGDEGGVLHMWDVAAQLGEPATPAPGAWTPPQPNGLYPPLPSAPPSAVNAVAAAPAGTGAGGSGGVVVVTAHEGGLLRCYSTQPAAGGHGA